MKIFGILSLLTLIGLFVNGQSNKFIFTTVDSSLTNLGVDTFDRDVDSSDNSISSVLAKKQQKIIIKNAISISRKNEIISIDKEKLNINNPALYPVVKNKSVELISQLSDENNDGQWDKLLIEISLLPNEIDTLKIDWVTIDKLSVNNNSTNVRFSYKSVTTEPTAEIHKLMRARGFVQNISNPVYQMEGPGIENEKVAFRHFFDQRNGKDVYGKLTNKMVLDKVGLEGSWHKISDWGMDILRTGGTIGAGGLAIREDNKIYPLADADSTYFNQIEEGPLRAGYNLSFKNWDRGTTKADGYEYISIEKGSFFYKEELKIPLLRNQKILTGMPNFSSDSIYYTVHNKKYSTISTYDKQADGNPSSFLGLAVMFATDSYAGKGKTNANDKYTNSSYVELNPMKNEIQTFWYFACWAESDDRFSTKNGFDAYLQEIADKLAYPIQITIVK